ncbi:MAG: ABC transporter permease, partial [Novosphingobium sp.]
MNLSWGAAWRLARRGLDWRFKGLRLLLVCLVLGTAALSAIGTLTGAIERELAARGREMLGADLEFTLAARQPAPQERAAIAAMGELSEGARLQAMARVPGDATRTTPIELKTVDGKWPLYGQFELEGDRKAGAPQGM